MVLDFAARPPEINSALMYSGPGADPMMATVAAWNNLAAELATAAASHESVIAELNEEWIGPASSAMAAAATPYVEWMNNAAAAAEHAAAQATASVAAYQSAHAMTVPPPLITANRVQLAALVATNIVGQNTPAIAATEVQYAEMWAQDAAAMYYYAGSSASAASLNPLTSPTATTNPAGAGAQTAAVSTASSQSQLSQLVSKLPTAMQSLASPGAATTSSGDGLLTSSGGNGFLNDLFSSGGNIGVFNYTGAAVGFGMSGVTGAVGVAGAQSAGRRASRCSCRSRGARRRLGRDACRDRGSGRLVNPGWDSGIGRHGSSIDGRQDVGAARLVCHHAGARRPDRDRRALERRRRRRRCDERCDRHACEGFSRTLWFRLRRSALRRQTDGNAHQTARLSGGPDQRTLDPPF